MEKTIAIIDESGDDKMLWEAIGKPAYEKGLLAGRQEAGLYAVIPMSILENKVLSANAKLLYGEIMALSKKSGKCYATNEYLAEMVGLKKASMPQILRELSGTGLILVDIQRSKKGTYRNITVSFFNNGGHQSTTMGGIARQLGQSRNRQSRNRQSIPAEASQSDAGKVVNEIIFLFKEVNPMIEKLYGNKSQRAAIERMVKVFGRAKVEEMIKILPRLNAMQYYPKSTTPVQLENNIPIYKAKKEEAQAPQKSKLKVAIIT